MAIHRGGQSLTGHTAELQWYPQHSFAVALLYNAYPRVPRVSDVVPTIVLGVPLPAPAAAPSAVTPSATATPAERTKLAGVYELTAQRTFEVVLGNGELYVTPSAGSKQPLVVPLGNYLRARIGRPFTPDAGRSDSTTMVTLIIENGVATGFEANDNGSRRTLKRSSKATAHTPLMSSAHTPQPCVATTSRRSRRDVLVR
jgi:hypothetical protein